MRLFNLGPDDLTAIANNLPNAYIYRFVHPSEGTPFFIYVSEGIETLRGVSMQEVLDDPDILRRQIDPAYLRDFDEAQTYSATHLTDLVSDLRIRRPAGDWRWIRIRSRPWRDRNGAIVWDGVTTDVTSQKEMEAAFRDTERKLAAALEGMIEGYQILDFDFRYVYVNASAARQGQKALGELLGRGITEAYPGVEQTALFAELQRCMRERVAHRMENTFTYSDGTSADFQLVIEPVPEGLLVISVDITEQKRMEVQLRRAQKMEAVGQLAGGIAHDFNNMLTVILGHTELLKLELAGTAGEQHIDQVLNAARSAASLTRQLLTFGRRHVLRPAILDLNEILKDLKKFLGRTIGEHIDLSVQTAADLWTIRGDRGQVEQIVMNLVVNARDAMPNGGILKVESSNVVLDEAYAGKLLNVQPGAYVMLAVSDTGVGMSTDTQARIFEPFFTTKEAGKGTGLGLATVYGIVKQMNGGIWIWSEPGRGTTFKLYFPTGKDALFPAEAAAAPTPASRRATILLVEDDDMVRALAREVLQTAGHAVLEALTPAAAIEMCKAHSTGIDVMITDVVMPNMSGNELVERVMPVSPAMKVIYMSGYADSSVSGSVASPSNAEFLQKPFSSHDLLRKIHEVLEAGKGDKQPG